MSKQTMDRIKMWGSRRKIGLEPACDLCGVRPATEVHHIIPRNAVVGNPRAWQLIDDPLVKSALCTECHNAADMPENRDRIWRTIYWVNGRGVKTIGYRITKEHFDMIKALTAVTWDLPDVMEELDDGQ